MSQPHGGVGQWVVRDPLMVTYALINNSYVLLWHPMDNQVLFGDTEYGSGPIFI